MSYDAAGRSRGERGTSGRGSSPKPYSAGAPPQLSLRGGFGFCGRAGNAGSPRCPRSRIPHGNDPARCRVWAKGASTSIAVDFTSAPVMTVRFRRCPRATCPVISRRSDPKSSRPIQRHGHNNSAKLNDLLRSGVTTASTCKRCTSTARARLGDSPSGESAHIAPDNHHRELKAIKLSPVPACWPTLRGSPFCSTA